MAVLRIYKGLIKDLCVWVCVLQLVEGAKSLVRSGKGYN